VSQQILMLAILMLTSKSIAGVPRASLVVVWEKEPGPEQPDTGAGTESPEVRSTNAGLPTT
jgi:hypothetical protein